MSLAILVLGTLAAILAVLDVAARRNLFTAIAALLLALGLILEHAGALR